MFIQYIFFKVRIFKKINRKFFLDKKIKQKKLKNPKNQNKTKKPPKSKYKNQTKKKIIISVYVGQLVGARMILSLLRFEREKSA